VIRAHAERSVACSPIPPGGSAASDIITLERGQAENRLKDVKRTEARRLARWGQRRDQGEPFVDRELASSPCSWSVELEQRYHDNIVERLKVHPLDAICVICYE
jgi:hypothetical protein